MTIFLQTRIYMRTKNPYICVTNKHVVYAVAESRLIRGTKLYRQQKTPSCTELKISLVWINHGCNARVNFEQDFVLIHCPHSSGGCRLPDNGFVGIRGLSLERRCTLFHKCWPKQRSNQLKLASDRQNTTHKLLIMWNMTWSPFFFSLSRANYHLFASTNSF